MCPWKCAELKGEVAIKRFVDTADWNDPAFRRLSPQAKHLRRFLWDHCDCAGVVPIDLETVSHFVGEKIKEQHLAELGDWLEPMPNRRLLIPTFVHFQYGDLSTDCRAHIPVFKTINTHNLVRSGKLYHLNPSSLCEKSTIDYVVIPHRHKEQEQEQVQEKEGDKGSWKGGYHEHARVALHFLNEKSGRHFRETDENLRVLSARLSEPEVNIQGVKQMIERQCKRWLGTDQSEYLRPETLFGKTKFESYYAAKDVPLALNGAPPSPPPRKVLNLPTL